MNCNICAKPYPDLEMLQTNCGEFFCKNCFKSKYYEASNRMVNTKLLSKEDRRSKGDSLIEPRKMFPDDELSIIKTEIASKAGPSIYTYSKRPLQCPHVDCNKYVRSVDLNAHFLHDHVDVKLIESQTDTRTRLSFLPADIRYGSKQCLALIQLKPSDNAPTHKLPNEPIALMLLASRIATAELVDEDDVDEDEQSRVVNYDKIIVWLASNISTFYNYAVAVSTIAENVRVKFNGPILQLGYCPKTLCKEGQCLILSHFHFLGMSENGTKPLHLDLIINSND